MFRDEKRAQEVLKNRNEFSVADEALQFTYDPWVGVDRPSGPYRESIERPMLSLRNDLVQARRLKLSNEFADSILRPPLPDDAFIHSMQGNDDHVALADVFKIVNETIAYSDLAHLPFPRLWIECDHPYTTESRLPPIRPGEKPRHPKIAGRQPMGYLLTRINNDPGRWIATVFRSTEIDFGKDAKQWSDTPVFATTPSRLSWAFGIAPVERARMWGGSQVDERSEKNRSGKAWGFHQLDEPNPYKCMQHDTLYELGGTVLTPSLTAQTLLFAKANPQELQDDIQEETRSTMGVLNFLVRVLATINYLPVEYKSAPVRPKYQARFRKLDFMSMSVVTIKASAKRVVRLLNDAMKREQAKRRAHEVRGHWRHYNGLTACRSYPDHKWAITSARHETCGRCGMIRVWIEEHMRGDAEIGFVQHDYRAEK